MDYKTTEEYLVILAEEAKYLKPKDAKTLLSFYENKISVALDYGETEEQILSRLPDPSKVAEEAYESHGFNYKKLREKKNKQKSIFDKVTSIIILLFLLISFIGVSYLSIIALKKMFTLLSDLSLLTNVLDKVISIGIVISYLISFILLFIYIFDIFYLISIHFLVRIIKFKDEQKLLSFSISNIISTKTKVKKFNLKFLLGFVSLIVLLMIASVCTKGYCYRSLNDICSNKDIYTLDNSIDTININSNDIIVNIYATTEDSYYEYSYEFKNKLTFNQTNNIIDINIDKSNSYDLFDLLKEPTQVVNIYLNNKKDIYINTLKEVEISVVETNINDLTVESEKATIACRKVKINNLNVTSYTGYVGLAESEVEGCINHNTTKGQFLIDENSNVNSVNSTNVTGLINITDSSVNDLVINNNTGSITLTSVNVNNLTLVNKTAQTNIYTSNITNANVELIYTSKLLVSESTIDESIVKLEANSYLVCEDIEGNNMNITSTSGNIFIDEYASEIKDCNLKIETSGSNTKTEITNSKIKDIYITHKDGFLFIENTNMAGKIICEASQTVEFTNNDGTLVELYLSKIGKSNSSSSWINITSDNKNDLIYKVNSWDAYSASCLSSDDNVNLDTTDAYDEGGTKNE